MGLPPDTLRAVVRVRVVVDEADEVEPPDGGRSTGAFLMVVVVLLARVCVNARFVGLAGPSEDVGLEAGLTPGLGLVVVVEGG